MLLQVLDIVLMQHNATFHRSIGHGVFNADDDEQHLLLGSQRACDTELWLGHRQTVVLTDSGPMLKVHRAATTCMRAAHRAFHGAFRSPFRSPFHIHYILHSTVHYMVHYRVHYMVQVDLAATTMLAPMSVLDFVAYKLGKSPAELEMNAEQIQYVGRQLQVGSTCGYGCGLPHVRLQPPLDAVAAFRYTRLQLAASTAHGCSLHRARLHGCRATRSGRRTTTASGASEASRANQRAAPCSLTTRTPASRWWTTS